METSGAIRALSGLAHESRLAAFRQLARRAPDGMSASALATALGMPASTLSFHLDQLVDGELLRRERNGRSVIYSLAVVGVNELLWFLGEDCCQGNLDLCTQPTARIRARVEEAAAPSPRQRVLFMCSHNSARSQMAEAILRREAGERYDVHSCGLRPDVIHPLTLQVLEEVGIDTSVLRSKDLGDYLGKMSIHHAVIVCEAANDHCPRLHPFALHLHYWPFADPAAAEGSDQRKLEAFRSVRNAIEGRIRLWLRSGTNQDARPNSARP